MPSMDQITEWIEDRYYKQSLTAFKAPALPGDIKIKWFYVKKEVRNWYRINLQAKIEEQLRKVNLGYLVDLDEMDAKNIKFHQKINRQILFIVALIVWVIEFIWDMIFPSKPEEKKKKSILKKAKKTKTEEDESADKEPEKKKDD